MMFNLSVDEVDTIVDALSNKKFDLLDRLADKFTTPKPTDTPDDVEIKKQIAECSRLRRMLYNHPKNNS